MSNFEQGNRVYSSPFLLKTSQGNNSLSFSERIKVTGNPEIRLPSLKKIKKLEAIELGNTICLEEIDENGILRSNKGLQHIYHLEKERSYIVDNHNHALLFWLQWIRKNADTPVFLVHIDQHSDLNTPQAPFDTGKLDDDQYLWEYTNLVCQISTFIKPFIESFETVEFTRIKTEGELLDLVLPDDAYLLLDIDLDFRAPEMDTTTSPETMKKVRSLMQRAKLTTIATSPMFIDQGYSLEILKKIFDAYTT